MEVGTNLPSYFLSLNYCLLHLQILLYLFPSADLFNDVFRSEFNESF